MENITQHDEETALYEQKLLASKLQRRSFLKYAGAASASMALIAAGCKKDSNTKDQFDFGTGDVAILNYAYALEQLEAAFYVQVINTPYNGISELERGYLTDIRDHEIAHREFFKAALGSAAIAGLSLDLSSINFSDRTSVLNAAKSFEDLGVSAYNGAGFLIKSADYLLLAGKIVSVEARHAALIRDLISNGTFVGNDVVDPVTGLDTSRSPTTVLSMAKSYITTNITTTGLPTY